MRIVYPIRGRPLLMASRLLTHHDAILKIGKYMAITSLRQHPPEIPSWTVPVVRHRIHRGIYFVIIKVGNLGQHGIEAPVASPTAIIWTTSRKYARLKQGSAMVFPSLMLFLTRIRAFSTTCCQLFYWQWRDPQELEHH